jgi:hypothetical protein
MPAWQEAEGLLLLGATALQASAPPQQRQQQQQLALCRQYQLQFQRSASSLGMSAELTTAVAAWFTEAKQYSSSSSSSSRAAAGGTAAAAAAAADCMSTMCAASLLLALASTLVDPLDKAEAKQRQLTAADELNLAGFYMQVSCITCIFSR